MDNWKHRSFGMRCSTCIWFVLKQTQNELKDSLQQVNDKGKLGRCRRHAPSMNGFVPVFESDWCGDHRLDENKI